MTKWRWPNFTKAEMCCQQVAPDGKTLCGCGGSFILNEKFMDVTQLFRDMVGVPVIPNSVYRCLVHNANWRGAKNSMHTKGMAIDVRITPKLTREKIHANAKLAGFKGIGDYNTFVHLDIGQERYWDARVSS